MTPFDLIELAKRAQSAQELLELAQQSKIKLSREDAAIYFDRWHGMGELSDDDLDLITGGAEEYAGKVVCEVCGGELDIDLSEGGYYCGRCRMARLGRRVL